MKEAAQEPRLHFVDSVSDTGALGARFRRTRSGPELELIEAFIRAMPLDIPRGCRATVFREPRLESGFPDLVIVVWQEDLARSWRAERALLESHDLRLMHFLHHVRRARHEEIFSWFGRRASGSIERLYSSAMIRQVGTTWMPCALSSSFAALKIIAVEAKIGKWTAVFNQALLNTWFASKSYVLVPQPPTQSQIAEARKLGIGVCSLDDRTVKEIASETTRLPRSYASWMLNEWAWKADQGTKVKT